jgi:hypothetical protein
MHAFACIQNKTAASKLLAAAEEGEHEKANQLLRGQKVLTFVAFSVLRLKIVSSLPKNSIVRS